MRSDRAVYRQPADVRPAAPVAAAAAAAAVAAPVVAPVAPVVAPVAAAAAAAAVAAPVVAPVAPVVAPSERSPARDPRRNVRVQQPFLSRPPSASAGGSSSRGPSALGSRSLQSISGVPNSAPARGSSASPSASSSATPLVRSCRSGAPPLIVAAAPPAPPPHAAPVRRTDDACAPLALQRPVRSSRLAVVPRLQPGVPGSWSSG